MGNLKELKVKLSLIHEHESIALGDETCLEDSGNASPSENGLVLDTCVYRSFRSSDFSVDNLKEGLQAVFFKIPPYIISYFMTTFYTMFSLEPA